MSSAGRIKLEIASPCNADWDQMAGDDAVRFCGKCEKHVYQLSEMTTTQVEALLALEGETPCVRFYQRKDGTILTGDCPVGARRVRRKRTLFGLGAGALSAIGLALSPGGAAPVAGAADVQTLPQSFVHNPGAARPLCGSFGDWERLAGPEEMDDEMEEIVEVPMMGEPVAVDAAAPEPPPRPRMGRPVRMP
jgi:hypothetical protein